MKKFKNQTKKKKKDKKKENDKPEETNTKVNYEIKKNKLDTCNISEDEILKLKDEIKIIVNETNKDNSLDLENFSNEEEELKENIKSDFMDKSNYFSTKDNYSEKGNLIINTYSNDIKGSLNNQNNPFIKAQKYLQLTQELKLNNIKIEKDEIKISENK